MKRHILHNLKKWKLKKGRKPLILKGVRQTGKTWILKEFGKKEFSACHYLNFELNKKAANLFREDLDPKRILNEISFLLDHPIDIKNDLLIFDEIQECPEALTSLKYFCEKMPELAVCCAGSLLGLHLSNASFPVGKVDFLSMHPMSFPEFLEAAHDIKSLSYLNSIQPGDHFSEIVHEHLWQQFKIYLVTGGLPEVVETWLNHSNGLLYPAFVFVREKQNELIHGYYADIAKHAGKVNAMHIDHVWRAIPAQLAQTQDGSAKRFHFRDVIPGIDRYQRLASVFDWLGAAQLVIRVPVIEHAKLPLMAQVEESRFKLYMFDTGILGALADLPPKSIMDYDYGTYKGYYAENFIAQEFVAKNITKLYSWQNNRAEIEFLYSENSHIIPIEVKSGGVIHSQSLNKFAEKYHPPCRVLFSAKPLHIDLTHHFHRYPLYMAHWFPLTKPNNDQ